MRGAAADQPAGGPGEPAGQPEEAAAAPAGRGHRPPAEGEVQTPRQDHPAGTEVRLTVLYIVKI